ncbi:hypothetical protein [Pseudoleptotrichia goodfellowii]|uniref:AB hydrolase-1 domain-containing protein n=1 Tax=Pseudoleptotrichia goodfellowii F0264 TaxID=596323 RepID=D0GJS6_9FUSO|nr:hypothetical protein [Pseudoleptotrichia goodfellowii]EEY35582.1 hypothetical protein HMPREF0554_1067 [Pseudoleptotrichia goodfellowii F0264]
MLRKVLLIMAFALLTIIGKGEVTDISKIAEDYPYKENAILSTVLGTPSDQWYKFKKAKGPTVKRFKANKAIPAILRQWSDYEYGVWKQKKEAPLMILISGTGSLYNSGLSMFLANVFYERGYNVIAFSSTSTMPYIVSQSKNNYAGYVKDEVPHLYELMAKAISTEKSSGMKIGKIYVGGYSLGGFQSLLIHELDSKSKKIGIDKSLLLNTPVSILTATKQLDKYLIKNGIYNAAGLEKFLDRIFSRIINDKTLELSDIDFTSLNTTLGKLQLTDSDFEALTGLLFRFYSANMTFAGEVFSGRNAIGRLSNKKSYQRFDSVTKEFHEGLSVSFDEYSKEILYPYLKKYKYPDLTMEQFIKDFSLDNSREFIERNSDKIVFITSENDILINEDELAYINKYFTNRVIIPFGGHTGVLWHRDVAKLMVDKMEEN